MPKMKTKSGAKKRFRVRPGGTVKRGQDFYNMFRQVSPSSMLHRQPLSGFGTVKILLP